MQNEGYLSMSATQNCWFVFSLINCHILTTYNYEKDEKLWWTIRKKENEVSHYFRMWQHNSMISAKFLMKIVKVYFAIETPQILRLFWANFSNILMNSTTYLNSIRTRVSHFFFCSFNTNSPESNFSFRNS